MILHNSKLAVMASGMPLKEGFSSPEEEACAMCGQGFEHATCHVAPFINTFNNQPQLAARDSSQICNYCATLIDKSIMQKYSKSVVTTEGFFKFASNLDRAYWLLNPPDGEFMMVSSDQQQQHLYWYAPVNLSKDLFYVQHGYQVLKIRHKKLLEAIEVTQAFMERHDGKQLFFKGKDDPDLMVTTSRFLQEESEKETAAFINALTVGERWATRICVTASKGLDTHTPTQVLPI